MAQPQPETALRSDPVARRQYPGPLALLLCLLIGTGPALAADPNPPSRKLEEVQQQLKEAETRRRTIEQENRDLQSKARDVQTRLVQAARQLHSREEQISRIEEEADRLAKRERESAAALDARREELAATLATLARISRQPPEAMILAPMPALDMVRASQLLAHLVPEVEARASALKAEIEGLSRLRAALAREQASLARAVDSLERERQELEVLQADTNRARDLKRAEGEEETRRAAKLAQEAKDLRALVERLAEEERKSAAEARLRAEREKTQQRAARPAPPEDFALKEGSAALPARGRMIARFGEPDENGAALRGIRIETRGGAQVISPADGKVVFAGPFRGYGQLLIIAHGGGYHSLLAGFGRIDSVVGQWLLAGEPVGQMGGPNDGIARPILYLELRRKGEPVNPVPWLASGDRKVSG